MKWDIGSMNALIRPSGWGYYSFTIIKGLGRVIYDISYIKLSKNSSIFIINPHRACVHGKINPS